jgi:hypothetical protein
MRIEQIADMIRSWSHSINEYTRLGGTGQLEHVTDLAH